jgi:SRSO17 transposase
MQPSEAGMTQANVLDMRPLDQQDIQLWHTVYWAELERRLRPHFARTEARSRALTSIAGLLSPAERKNGWQLAEITGDATPYGVQHLLGRAIWDPDALRDELRSYVLDSHYITHIDSAGEPLTSGPLG